METTGFFVIHDELPHLVLDGFPRDLLKPPASAAVSEGEAAVPFVPPAVEGSWPVQTAEGVILREGFLLPLHGHLEFNGRKEAAALCHSLKNETLVRGLHKIRLDDKGKLTGWGRKSAVA